ncbi:MAG TPA: hypothetical protein VL588_11965 [Bdellovibrionota bacterium]|jgi:hypothetical protein|nr:hypothetical protein [Bdellovibrionota bacterium]
MKKTILAVLVTCLASSVAFAEGGADAATAPAKGKKHHAAKKMAKKSHKKDKGAAAGAMGGTDAGTPPPAGN